MKYSSLLLALALILIGCQIQEPKHGSSSSVGDIPSGQETTTKTISLDQLIEEANSFQCAKRKVPGRGVYPTGWYNGMILAFTRSACRGLESSGADRFYTNMVQSDSPGDSLKRLMPSRVNKQTYTKRYNRELAQYSARVHQSGKNQLYLPVYDDLDLDTESDQLHVLYSLLMTLGMRESSGGKDNGIDKNAFYYKNCMRNTPEQCEAGSLQASQNSTASTKMKHLFPGFADDYWQALSSDYESTCRWHTFNEGIAYREEDPVMQGGTLKRTGDRYHDFRNLMIGCPMANVEYNAILLRKTYAHHGPIKRFEAPLFGECIDMFAKIHELINKNVHVICEAALDPLQ